MGSKLVELRSLGTNVLWLRGVRLFKGPYALSSPNAGEGGNRDR